MTIGIGTGAMNFVTSGTFFVASSFASSGVQKKESSETRFRIGDVGDEVISFVSSASGSQKKERSEMGFVQGDTGDETSFLGGTI